MTTPMEMVDAKAELENDAASQSMNGLEYPLILPDLNEINERQRDQHRTNTTVTMPTPMERVCAKAELENDTSPPREATLCTIAQNPETPAIISIQPTTNITTHPEFIISDRRKNLLSQPFNLRETHSYLHPKNRCKLTCPRRRSAWCEAICIQRWLQCIGPATGGKLQLSTEEFHNLVQEGSNKFDKCVVINMNGQQVETVLDIQQNMFHALTTLILEELAAANKVVKNLDKRSTTKARLGNYGNGKVPYFIHQAVLPYLPLSTEDKLRYYSILSMIWGQVPRQMFPIAIPDPKIPRILRDDRTRKCKKRQPIGHDMMRNGVLIGIMTRLYNISVEVYDKMGEYMKENYTEEELRECDEEWRLF